MRVCKVLLVVSWIAADVGLTVLSGAAESAQTGVSASRPNILLITADDLGMQLGCYGEKQIRTPHLDRLAGEGTLFERAYVTASICSPSRSSILKGLYPHQTGHLGNARGSGSFPIKPGVPNLFAVLKTSGYRVGLLGKLHVEPKEEFAFDLNQLPFSREVKQLAQAAEGFMSLDRDKPFFLMVNYLDPHMPFIAQVSGLPEKPLTPDQVQPPPEFVGWKAPVVPSKDGTLADYYNSVVRMDAGVGLLMEALAKTGRADNTLVIFLSDNGPHFAGRGKGTLHEGGLHVPFIVRWPGHAKPGVRSRALVSAVDIVPTVAEAAGIQWSGPLAGRSLMPLLQGQNDVPWRRDLCSEWNSVYPVPPQYAPARSIRDKRYRLILHLKTLVPGRSPPKGDKGTPSILSNLPADAAARLHTAFELFHNPPAVELYDLEEDPQERTNLAGKPEVAEVQKRLMAGLRAWCEQTDDQVINPAIFQKPPAQEK